MALVNKIQPSQSVPPTRHPGKLKRVGSLVELFDFFVLNEGKVIDTVSVNTFLYTYRLFADMELVLEVVNKKQQPHVKDFDSPQKIIHLKCLVRILAGWFDVFQPSYNQDSHNYILNEFMRCCGNNVFSKNQDATRIVLCNIDSEVWDRVTAEMEYLCRQAINCLKIIACKHQIDLNPEKKLPSVRIITINRASCHHSSHNPAMHKSEKHFKEIITITPSINPLINLWNLNLDTVAEQLTVADQRLFLDMELNDCLIYARGKPAPSVQATIDQYNKLYHLVQSSMFNSDQDFPILVEPTPIYSRRFNKRGNYNSPATRVSPQIITIWSKSSPNHNSSASDVGKLKTGCIITWIDIAYDYQLIFILQPLAYFFLRIFSFLCKRKLSHYHEHFMKFKYLASVVSFDNNQEQLRKRLDKCANKMYWYLKLNNPNPLCPNQSSYLSGVIPYLGVFLSDLTLLHHSSPDYISRSKYSPSNKNKQEIITNNQKIKNPYGIIKLLHISDQLGNFTRSTPDLSVVVASSSTVQSDNNSTKQSWKLLKNVSNTNASPVKPSVSADRNDNIQLNGRVKKEKFGLSRRHSTIDSTDDKLINLDKHRREFKILANIFLLKILANIFLLQQNAQFYSLRPEPDFSTWFHSYPLISENEALNRSCDLEPADEQMQQHVNRPFSRNNKSRINGTYSSSDLLDDIKYNRSTTTDELITGNTLDISNQQNNHKHNMKTSTSRWTTHKSSSTTFDTRNDYNSNLSITVSLHHTNSQHDGRVSPFIAKVAHLGSLSHGSHGHNDNHFSHSKQTQPIIQLSVSPVDSVSDVLSKALKLFGCADQKVDNYDLIHVHKDARDITLPKHFNFYESINYSSFNLSNNKHYELLEFICTPTIHNENNNDNNNSLNSSPSSSSTTAAYIKANNNTNYHGKKHNPKPNMTTTEYTKQYKLTSKSSNKHCTVELWS
ncbi:putative ral guanine nucleotide dissociation stimulator,ralgds [Schistosoma mansoni]|uniref:putative ral guanine nucleotide dissociation stimulator,ralgds n=1 Tax=Schistosoma mansoni TaxID=6183 RepID=UPI00022DC758|nr:putative ral guanine nucleotide dissociation stimulator,ralgds [Schistosoma mansoni]|eukprot:XP_018649955.1 putative ral guanine nucleotide dissociation stimulator,ralgds [Schistosoma mansoni]